MKTSFGSRRSGSALMLALVAFLFMAGIGGAIFSLTMAGRRTTMAASFGDAAFHVAEAGIDDAINRMRAYQLNFGKANPTDADFLVLEATTKDETGTIINEFSCEKQVRGGSYTVRISPAFEANIYRDYTITAVGALAGETRCLITHVSIRDKKPNDDFGLFGDVYLDAGGNIKTDGYNGALGTWASQITNTVGGVPVALKEGHVGSNGNVDVAGSSQIYGNATPGPGETVTGGGTVYGDTTAAEEVVALQLPTMAVPSGTTNLGDIKAGATIAPGVWEANSMSPTGNGEVTITGDTTIYVNGDFDFAGQVKLNIKDGAKLTIYQNSKDATAKLSVAGGSVINSNQKAESFQIYSNTAKGKLTGNSDFYGLIYAPQTAMSILGTAGLFGSTMAKTIDIQGTPYFHYDISLQAINIKQYEVKVKSVQQKVPTFEVKVVSAN